MSGPRVYCPSCGGDALRRMGPIPASNMFAGRYLEGELPGGVLWRCLMCHLAFRHPRPPKHELDERYRHGHSDNWPDPVANRTDWVLAAELISALPNVRHILDVGCFDGKLLEYLGPKYVSLGIEIHEAAAQRARGRGVQIVASDFSDLEQLRIDADVVLALDVIEHTHDPRKFLESVVAALKPGGWIILTTGNTEAFSWRLMKGSYWYCHIAEHLSFINPLWIHQAARELELNVVSIRSFSHAGSGGGLKQKWRELAGNLLLRFAPRLFARLRRQGLGGIDIERYPGLACVPPYWMTARDHMLVLLRKS